MSTPEIWKALEWEGETVTVEALTPDGQLVVREVCHVLVDEDDAEQAKSDLLLIASAPNLRKVAQAALLFHSPSPWDLEKRERWTELTGATECTTKSLCDFARRVLAESGGDA